MTAVSAGASGTRYSGGAILFHWTIAALIVVNLIIAFVTEDWEGPSRGQAMAIHKATGFTILILSLARLGWRLYSVWPGLRHRFSVGGSVGLTRHVSSHRCCRPSRSIWPPTPAA